MGRAASLGLGFGQPRHVLPQALVSLLHLLLPAKPRPRPSEGFLEWEAGYLLQPVALIHALTSSEGPAGIGSGGGMPPMLIGGSTS